MDRSPCIVFNHKCGHLQSESLEGLLQSHRIHYTQSLVWPENTFLVKKVYLRTFSWHNVLILYQILCCFNHVTRNAHLHAEPRNITFNGQCALKSTRESWLYLNKIFGKNSLNRIASSVSNNNVLYCIMI